MKSPALPCLYQTQTPYFFEVCYSLVVSRFCFAQVASRSRLELSCLRSSAQALCSALSTRSPLRAKWLSLHIITTELRGLVTVGHSHLLESQLWLSRYALLISQLGSGLNVLVANSSYLLAHSVCSLFSSSLEYAAPRFWAALPELRVALLKCELRCFLLIRTSWGAHSITCWLLMQETVCTAFIILQSAIIDVISPFKLQFVFLSIIKQ